MSTDTRGDELGLWLGVDSIAPDGEEEWASQNIAQPQHMADLSKFMSAFHLILFFGLEPFFNSREVYTFYGVKRFNF